MIKLKDLLSEGKWKIGPRTRSGMEYIVSPSGATTSIPQKYDRDAIIAQTRSGDTFKIYNGNAGKPYAVGNSYDKTFKNINDLVKWLNKEKLKYVGIDNR